MGREIIKIANPSLLDERWDNLTSYYYQKREFIDLLHRHNYCQQRYYELYRNGMLAAGAVVYTLRINIFTFSGLKLPVKMNIIGLPASIATTPLIGDSIESEYLFNKILELEKGIILGLNLLFPCTDNRVVTMRMLPTLIFNRTFLSFPDYVQSMRHSYRRRIMSCQRKFCDVETIVTDCNAFTHEHYRLYLEIIRRTNTKLETLNYELFRNLPSNFILTTHYREEEILAWHICTIDNETLFFFVGGMNYSYRNAYNSYYNNLISILRYAIKNNIHAIDFGQTAGQVKMRLGCVPDERKMCLFHKNIIVMSLFRVLKRLIEYSERNEDMHVFKETSDDTINESTIGRILQAI